MKDTVSVFQDCTIEVELLNKRGEPFLFPSNYIIDNEADLLADLQVIIEKMEDKKFRNYLCKYTSVHYDGLKTDSLLLKKYKSLVIVDSLEYVNCINRGNYRLKVAYNKRPVNGEVDNLNVIAESNWVYFYVDNDEIILRRYWLKNK